MIEGAKSEALLLGRHLREVGVSARVHLNGSYVLQRGSAAEHLITQRVGRVLSSLLPDKRGL